MGAAGGLCPNQLFEFSLALLRGDAVTVGCYGNHWEVPAVWDFNSTTPGGGLVCYFRRFRVLASALALKSQAVDQSGEVTVRLRSAMTQQGPLKVPVLCGYYDVATPFNGIEHTVSHMNPEPVIRKNISFAYYEAGHMMYIEKKSREKLHRDVAAFINGAANTTGAGGGQ